MFLLNFDIKSVHILMNNDTSVFSIILLMFRWTDLARLY